MIFLTRRLLVSEKVVTTVTLDLETRLKSRVKIVLDDGREAGLMLKYRQLIRGGDILSDELGKEIVRVVAANEKVSVVSCNDPLLLLRACYHLGNRHVPLQIKQSEVRYHHDYILDEMVRNLGLELSVEIAPFEPEAGAYQSTLMHHYDHEHHH